VAAAGRTVTWSKSGAGGTFATPTSSTNATGVATVTFNTSTEAGISYTFTGTDNLGAAGTSGAVTTVAGTGTQYLVSTDPASVVVAGAQVTITAQLADANGNPVAEAGRTVTWSKTGAGGTFATPTSSTNASGVATVTFTTATEAGISYTFTGTDNLGAGGTSGAVTTTAGEPTQYLVSTDPASSVVAGGDVTITAQLADANGNPVAEAGRTVTWSSTNGGSLSPNPSSTDANGIATVTFTTSEVPDTEHVITATDADVPTITGQSPSIVTQEPPGGEPPDDG
jgi:hypothetical protein